MRKHIFHDLQSMMKYISLQVVPSNPSMMPNNSCFPRTSHAFKLFNQAELLKPFQLLHELVKVP